MQSTSRSSPESPSSGALGSDGSERRQLTVLFCDLVGSTALSEQMDPEDLRVVLRDYQQRCAAVIRRFQGHVAQYLGDGLMVYFGYPVADEAAPRRAVEAALTLVESFTAKQDPSFPDLSVRIGIHTGSVVVGDMGDASRPERLAVGATPNLAARVQAQAESNSVFLSEATHALVVGYFECETVGATALRGVSKPITLYRVLGRGPASTRLEASERRGLTRFAGRDAELAMLRERWEARHRGGAAMLISGDPGVGKSRIVHELSKAIGGHGSVQLSAFEHSKSEAFFPITRHLERWAGFTPKTPREEKRARLAARLAELDERSTFPELATLLSIDVDPDSVGRLAPSPRQHAVTIQKLVGLFARLARTRPLLVVVDDLQWADVSTQ